MQARAVSTSISTGGAGRLSVDVRDDGAGFDLEAVRIRSRNGESIGVFGMQERATLAGGVFTLESAPGQGTRVRAEFPARDLKE